MSSHAPHDDGLNPPIPSYDEAMLSPGMLSNGQLPSPSTFDPFSPMGEAFYAPENESRGLLHHTHQRQGSTATNGSRRSANRSSRPRNSGYRPPTVETDDEDSTWSSSDDERTTRNGRDGDDDDLEVEAAHVRREMIELDMEDPLDSNNGRGRPSIFGKGFSLSLPKWASNWRLSIPRLRIQLPSGPESPDGTAPSFASRFGRLAGFSRVNTTDAENPESADSSANTQDTTRRRWFARPEWTKRINTAVAIVVFVRIFAVTMILGFVYLLFMSDLFTSLSRRLGSQVFDPESVRMHIQMSVNPARMRDMSKHFTSYAHMAGTEGDFALALDVKNLFTKYGLDDVTVDEYYVYLNYPRKDGRAVEILGADGKATWSAKLEEEEAGGEAAGHQTYAFHGLSKAGDVHGPLIYANYGSRDDFKKLKDSGIVTDGAIALVRYYGTQSDRALKVKAAELAGFAGCLIYSDPVDDGFIQGEVAPEGRYMPADGVQRGSVSLMSYVIGDVLTPGWESKKGLPRLAPEKSAGLVKIPSLPLAWRDAQVLLQQLKGAGQRVPKDWEGGVPDVPEWWTGNKTGSPIVRLKNEQDEETQQPVWNVYGRIEGVEQSAKKILIGNHRDSWTFGSTDPHSGTAIMLEVARIFGDLVERGWRPLRTIEFMSWDAEEYNLIGSTEYVENNLDSLRRDGLAYINLDTAVTGGQFHAAGSPVFSKLLNQVMKRVSDPNVNATLHDLWEQNHSTLEELGAGSDYVAFQDLAGTSSLDLHFDGPGYPAHSSYDNFDWMDRVGDPGFVYHGMLGEVVGLLLIELADRPVMPFDMTAYGDSIGQWTKDLMQWVQGQVDEANKAGHGDKAHVSFTKLQEASDIIAASVREFDRWDLKWESQVLASGGWESTSLGQQRTEYITRMADFETNLLDLEVGGGIPGRTQFKHVVYGPQLWSSYDGDLFPAVKDLVAAGDWGRANQTVAKIAKIFEHAALQLLE
ncbi:glutamate carboxypeptidase 2 [Ophiostoma piceae UAMH 11346]|uniref:Glutamate carboxypeptidase 2 n=1 Tax=Ophiostoma piceae (strain UAMH 11346) TaxID=1262450 RepID=S3C858_OPHP1|nr:glutamate carboxypeptidase 2 [Ophiostoma piceae UAMH 11346]